MNTCSSHARVTSIILTTASFLAVVFTCVNAQGRVSGRRIGIVVDERLSVLRASPDLSGKLLRRIGRGRAITITGQNRSRDGILFYSVNVSRRTRGWLQKEAMITPRRRGDDERLLRLINASAEFDRLARARIFLDAFPHSPLRPRVLLLFGDTAEQAAVKLSHDAARRLDVEEMQANVAPLFSYSLNYSGLDRYSRQGVKFVFDSDQRKFHYEGTSWREVIRRYPRSPEAAQARSRLAAIVAKRR
ncbi:MAG: tol-pal system YbgF family protein [Pyrinomonadaceae bacterium]